MAKRNHEIVICPVCGRAFEKTNNRHIICGDKQCKKIHKARYQNEFRKAGAGTRNMRLKSGCLVQRAPGRCAKYHKCVHGYSCLSELSEMDWIGWKCLSEEGFATKKDNGSYRE